MNLKFKMSEWVTVASSYDHYETLFLAFEMNQKIWASVYGKKTIYFPEQIHIIQTYIWKLAVGIQAFFFFTTDFKRCYCTKLFCEKYREQRLCKQWVQTLFLINFKDEHLNEILALLNFRKSFIFRHHFLNTIFFNENEKFKIRPCSSKSVRNYAWIHCWRKLL